MANRRYIEVDPKTLHLPPSRASGADPIKLQLQRARYGSSVIGMPPIWAYRGSDGELMIFDGVTRATRIAMLLPGIMVRVELVGDLPSPCNALPTVGERLP